MFNHHQESNQLNFQIVFSNVESFEGLSLKLIVFLKVQYLKESKISKNALFSFLNNHLELFKLFQIICYFNEADSKSYDLPIPHTNFCKQVILKLFSLFISIFFQLF
jgi:hypothetical protein